MNCSDFQIAPQSYGIDLASLTDLRGGAPAENAAALTALLAGEHSAYRDIVLLNAGAALMIAGMTGDIPAGIDLARQSIDDGIGPKCAGAADRDLQWLMCSRKSPPINAKKSTR